MKFFKAKNFIASLIAVVAFILPAYSFVPAAEEKDELILQFNTKTEYKDFYYSVAMMLSPLYGGETTPEWVNKHTSQKRTNLNGIMASANKEFGKRIKERFVKSNPEDIKELIQYSMDHGIAVLARKSTIMYNKGIWVVIIGYLDKDLNTVVVHDSRSEPAEKVPLKEIGAVYILR